MDNISCFYPSDDDTAIMLFDGKVSNDNGDYDYALGQTNPFNPDLHPALKKNISRGSEEIVREIMNSSVDGKRFIQYYAPLFNDEGELICVVSESLWLSDLIRSIVKGVLIVEALNALFHMLILLILLHLLNKSIGKPMLMLRDAVTTYADDKDTDNFVKSLVPIGALGNEFGIFSKETASMAVELRRFMDENLALAEEKKRLEGQLAMAAELKHQLMPNVFPAFSDEKRMEIYADQVAFEKIGGDYYDFFAIDRDHLALVIADIFDGGTPSALFMVAFKIILSRIASYGLPPSKIMEIVNNRLSRYNEDDLTLSAWFGIYEISTGRVTAVNAGHECPLIVSENNVREIEENIPGFIIGLTEGMTYRDYSFTLERGSHLFLYTDGILNAKNSSEESFGYDRMIKAISGAGKTGDSADRSDMYASLQREVGAVQDAVFEFVGDKKLCVDITMLVLGRSDA
ncbi:MAG: serine/threonine-protein phosphatase [Lachnospiraceae bacterium]|nr:serine/threonine-protein phosphatase [Lachnospiraceae bacterium]